MKAGARYAKARPGDDAPLNLPKLRAPLLFGALALLFAGLVGRSLYLQWIDNEFLQSQGSARHSRELEVPAHRGRIVDRSGEALVVIRRDDDPPPTLTGDLTRNRALAEDRHDSVDHPFEQNLAVALLSGRQQVEIGGGERLRVRLKFSAFRRDPGVVRCRVRRSRAPPGCR